MLIGDPVLLLMFLVVVAPSIRVLRKLIRRINAIAMSQFTGGAKIWETLQETVQGIRIVKAFTLEEQMRAKFDGSVGTLEHDSVKMARVSNSAGPLMEMLGGMAIALVVIYGGYRVIIVEDAVASSSAAGHRAALDAIYPRLDQQIQIATVDQVVAAWPASKS